MVEELWGAKDVERTHKDSFRAFGGFVILWRKNSMELISSFRGDGYVGVKAMIRGTCVH